MAQLADEIEEALAAYVATQTPVTALLGSGSAMRFRPARIAQGSGYPAVEYQVISTVFAQSHDNHAHLAMTRMQLTIRSQTFGIAKDVATALRLALKGYQGLWGDMPIRGVRFIGEGTDFDGVTQIHMRMLDIAIAHYSA